MTVFFGRLLRPQSSFRDLLIQALIAALLVTLGVAVFQQIQLRYNEIGIEFSFDFLGQTAGYKITDPIIEYEASNSHGRALLVGALSSLKLAVLVILVSSLFAALVTLIRLSRHRVLSFSAHCTCNILRNTPLLVQLSLFLFFSYAVFRLLPRPGQADRDIGIFLTSRGLYTPWIDNLLPLLMIFLVTLAVAFFLRRKLQQRRPERFKDLPVWLAWVLPLLAVVVSGWAFDMVPTIEFPQLNARGSKIIGGARLSEKTITAVLAFSLYAGSQLSDVFYYHARALLAERSNHNTPIGLRNTLRSAPELLPRFLQAISLPAANCYLTIFKNTALSGFVLYFGLHDAIGTTTNQTGRFVENMMTTFVFYLTIGGIALVLMRIYRSRLAGKGLSTTTLLLPIFTKDLQDRKTSGILSWLRDKLLYDWLSTAATFLSALLLVYAGGLIWDWVSLWSEAVSAKFDCTSAVISCWAHVAERLDLPGRLQQLLAGYVPAEETWRGYLTISLFLGSSLVCAFVPLSRHALLWFIFLAAIAMWSLTPGILPGASTDDLGRLGGLWLTLLLTSLAILAGFAIGNALALGSHSRLPLLSVICRGVISSANTIPPIVLIGSAAFILTMYLMPDGIARQYRFFAGTAGLILVASVQFAAVLRESLQIQADSLPAKRDLSLAIRNSIPTLTRTAVCQLHYTTFYQGVFATHDFLHVAKSAGWNGEWKPFYFELIVFVALGYFLISNLILLVGRRVEARRKAELAS